ncbi:FmdB family zinc ribbon protein [Microbacterium sp. bgisy203]|uniref:FmdB family zinc ribbon protein n=1 Tax=Microbacterium sp. bgisy203 TaxID=3413799 RepID=UPI003D73CBD6
MPTYAYACTQCGHAFDAVQSFSDASLTECPVCGGALRKQYGSVGVTFNGSGFYRTDSRKSAVSGDSSGGGATTSPSSKSEAKASPAPSGS